jgi:chaperonin GroEL (HSP60 family)
MHYMQPVLLLKKELYLVVVLLTSVLSAALRNSKVLMTTNQHRYCIIKRALEEPLRQIVENAGIEGSIVVQKVKEGKG